MDGNDSVLESSTGAQPYWSQHSPDTCTLVNKGSLTNALRSGWQHCMDVKMAKYAKSADGNAGAPPS